MALRLRPPEMQVGDEVWIVHSVRMPLIFRPNEDHFAHQAQKLIKNATRLLVIVISMALRMEKLLVNLS